MQDFTVFDSKKQQPTVYDAEGLEDSDDKEIWLIRVPRQIKSDNLKSLTFKYPKTEGKSLAELKLNENKDKYTLYKVPEGKTLESDVGISGQEMLGLTCLLPSKDNSGKLVFAPKKFSNYLILDEEVIIPDGITISETIRDTPITKREHPEGLKMRYKPYGYFTNPQQENDIQMKEETVEEDEKKVKKNKKKSTDVETDKEIKLEQVDDVDSLKRKRPVGDDDDNKDITTTEQEKKKKKKKEKKDKKDKKEKKEKKP
ncbi:unnamed protein product [Cunninghamella blakesleeana]